MSKKPIIVFEGIEGSGKSLHIKNVSNYLKKKKKKFIKIREPGGSKNSEKIRKIILNNKSNFNKNTDLLLYLASRSENIDKIIKKNYKKKIIFSINYNNKKIGLIIYNLKNCYYSIIILKQYRNKKAGTAALNKLVNFLRRKKLKLVTMINTNNKNSIYIHKKIAKSYKKINSKFIFFKIL